MKPNFPNFQLKETGFCIVHAEATPDKQLVPYHALVLLEHASACHEYLLSLGYSLVSFASLLESIPDNDLV